MIWHRHPVCRHVSLFFEMSVEGVRNVAKTESADGRRADGVDRRAERRIDNVVEVFIVVGAARIRTISGKNLKKVLT